MAKTSNPSTEPTADKQKKTRKTMRHTFRIDTMIGDKWSPYTDDGETTYVMNDREDAVIVAKLLRLLDKDLKGKRLSVVEIVEEYTPRDNRDEL